MNWDIVMLVVGGIFTIGALLFMSLMHLYMIPKDVMDRDTKPRKPTETTPAPEAENIEEPPPDE